MEQPGPGSYAVDNKMTIAENVRPARQALLNTISSVGFAGKSDEFSKKVLHGLVKLGKPNATIGSSMFKD